MAKKFVARRYDGDDQYSWGVFRAEDVKGKGNQLFFGDAQPLASGLSRAQALHNIKQGYYE